MLFSMTGFGRAIGIFQDKQISVEIRSLNSKMTDVKIKLPPLYKEKELELYKMVSGVAERGKIEVVVSLQSPEGELDYNLLNVSLFKGYFRQISNLCQELDIPRHEILPSLLRLPNILDAGSLHIGADEWAILQNTLTKAMDSLMDFRKQEGDALEQDFKLRIQLILDLLKSIAHYETGRIDKVKQKLRQSLNDLMMAEKTDHNRFEQELIYYLEKFDITEEKVRLEQHCKYFLEQLEDNSVQKGRKLNFISQEIGREINTIGSKANDYDMQRIVVLMKDELEKIKEQTSNIL